jgi:transcriptional regulator with XRE-family HTH domain
MSNNIDQFTPQEVGERLRIARESAKITQAAAADAINVARTTIVAIEQGQRRIRLDELQRLAITYDTSVNAVLRREAVYVDLKPRFRKGPEKNVEVERATDTLTRLVQAEIELESLLGVQRRSKMRSSYVSG